MSIQEPKSEAKGLPQSVRFSPAGQPPAASPQAPVLEPARPLKGVVAVIVRGGRFLVIRRSQFVRAPGMYCFPGGGIEAGETEPAALHRELSEELNVTPRKITRLWQSTTTWGVELAWWHVQLATEYRLEPNAAEVEVCHWYTAGEMRELADLLPSNIAFLDALAAGEFALPDE